MSERSTPESAALDCRLWLRPGRERSLLRGHPWVFSGAVERLEPLRGEAPGVLGEVVTASGQALGLATIHPPGPLTGRMVRWGAGALDAAFFAETIQRALRLRSEIIPSGTDAYRLVNAEGDGLAGLIVDRYADWLVVQCLTAGMAALEPYWLPALIEQAAPRGVIERGGHSRREAELARPDGLRWGVAPPSDLTIHEQGARYRVDLSGGQKTGFYLDQRQNRDRIAALAAGRSMLNAFAYTGGFGVSAGRGGAAAVTAVETSPAALALAEENWRINDLPAERLSLVRAPVQRFLRETRERFDLIVLDPPAFAKGQSQVPRAARAYKDINLWAMRCLRPGGYLATFSCSHHVGPDLFQKILFGAALDGGLRLQWLERLGAGPDHPVHLDHPQGEYLKGFLLRALEAR